ncbi:MAG: hypothetical protein AAB727_00605 [Patescibacteria group bacterium]
MFPRISVVRPSFQSVPCFLKNFQNLVWYYGRNGGILRIGIALNFFVCRRGICAEDVKIKILNPKS